MRRVAKSFAAIAVALATTLPRGDARAASAELQNVEIIAEAMCCQGCARKVSGKLYAARGVRSVSADVPGRAVTVQAPAAGETYLGTLWDAVVAGDGGPTSLATQDATYRLAPADSATGDATVIEIANPGAAGAGEQLATLFLGLEGVVSSDFDPTSATILVTTAPGRRLNPWGAAEQVVRAGGRPLRVAGPVGILTVEWREGVLDNTRTAAQPRNGQSLTVGDSR